MPQVETLRVVGYRDMMRAFAKADRDTKRGARETFRSVGESVRVDAVARFAGTDSRSAAGYRTRVRQRGIAVEQSLRRTTGKHPEYGRLQMRRALEPALAANEERVQRDLEHALDAVCDQFNAGGPV